MSRGHFLLTVHISLHLMSYPANDLYPYSNYLKDFPYNYVITAQCFLAMFVVC